MRARLLLAAGLALASSACTSKSVAPDRANFAQPSSVASFWGYTVAHASGAPEPYVVVANESRNDLTLVDAATNVVVNAPVVLRPLAVPFGDRPALLGGALLGDTWGNDPTTGFPYPRPSLLVGVSAGSSVLQLVKTWDRATAIDASQAVDLGADVLGIAALPPSPSTPGVARLAVALAGKKLAVVQYKRDAASDAIVKDASFGAGSGFVVHGLDFEPAAIATVAATLASSGDPAHVYAATLDPLAGGVHGVAEIDVSAPAEPWTYKALDARAPTRLVAAAKVLERLDATAATNASAFPTDAGGALLPPVTRVYALLDEASCGPKLRIDCGVVVLDPARVDPVTSAPAPGIPVDWAGWMPYRAPIQVGTRPSAIAIASPSFLGVPADPNASVRDRMLLQAFVSWATTSVALVAHEDGLLEILDLGRFKLANAANGVIATGASATYPKEDNRLWFVDPGTGAPAASDLITSDPSNPVVKVTPGYARDEGWKVSFQGPLPGLADRSAEAWSDGAGNVVLALQVGEGTPGAPTCTAPGTPAGCRSVTQVVKLWHPALGVRKGDIVAFKAARVPGCTGLPPPNTPNDLLNTIAKEFEAQIVDLLPPSPAAPGGALLLSAARTKGVKESVVAGCATTSCTPCTTNPCVPPEWSGCFGALEGALPLKGLLVTIDAGGSDPNASDALVLTGAIVGYAGRPALGADYVLQYRADAAAPDEDQLAGLCPLVDWGGTGTPPSCTGACDRTVCEQAVLARKARRVHHVAEDCGTGTDDATKATCVAKYPPAAFPFPLVNGPALRFRVSHQWTGQPTAAEPPLDRGLVLSFSTSAGLAPLSASPGGPQTRPQGALPFDRSPFDGNGGYRFFVAYPSGQLADLSPIASPVSVNVVR